MTFYEAALRVLEASGQPLHFQEITRLALEQNLLSHVGKMPEETMLSRLAAMARRSKDRRVMVTAKDTFSLSEWNLPEDLAALAVTGLEEPNPEADLPPLRTEERHPIPQPDIVRVAGRSERRRRFDEEDRGRQRKYPPLAEVVCELLSDAATGMSPEELLTLASERELVSGGTSTRQLMTALLEDNQGRLDAGRRPLFGYQTEGAKVVLEAPDSTTPGLDLQTLLAQAAGVTMENGRPKLAPEKPVVEAIEELDKREVATQAVKDARRAMLRKVRSRLMELDLGTLEKAVTRMMHADGFRELKVAKRSKEGPLLTGRRREGSLEFRYAVRLLKSSISVDRRAIQELKRDLSHYAAHIGLLVSAGDMRGDARSEAIQGNPLVFVWAGESLADRFLAARVGVTVTQLELFELDEQFFLQVRKDAEETRARREERIRDRQARESSEEALPVDSTSHDSAEEADSAQGESDSPGGEATEGAGGGDRKRRRRRRRRRRGPPQEGGSPESTKTGSSAGVEASSLAPVEAPVSVPESGGSEG